MQIGVIGSRQLPETHKNTCDIRNIAMADTDRIVLAKLLDLATEKQLAAIQAQINQQNAKTEKQGKIFSAQLAALEKQLKLISQKKERYLDSLIKGQFLSEERQAINAKIEEFTLAEKQIQAQIYAQQFELSQKQNQLYVIDDFKRELIFLKVNHKSLSEAQLGEWLNKTIERITYKQQGVTIRFKNYPVEV